MERKAFLSERAAHLQRRCRTTTDLHDSMMGDPQHSMTDRGPRGRGAWGSHGSPPLLDSTRWKTGSRSPGSSEMALRQERYVPQYVGTGGGGGAGKRQSHSPGFGPPDQVENALIHRKRHTCGRRWFWSMLNLRNPKNVQIEVHHKVLKQGICDPEWGV